LLQALLQISTWQERFKRKLPPISVNLSSRLFFHSGLKTEIRRLSQENRIEASLASLILEISVATIMADLESAFEIMGDLNNLGIRISADDFGTGHSSLGRLRRLPINSLKIDRSIVAEMVASSESLRIVRAVVSLAKTLGLKVVAKGIENREQYECVVDIECDYAQGFWLAPPVPVTEAEDLLAKEPRRWPLV
jgi:EAL domain-containing protein (putative c-di-GMP-specific phosphodiesterase class I)